LSDNPKEVNQYSGLETWSADKYQKDIKLVLPRIEDLDKWSCCIIKNRLIPLSAGSSEVVVEKPSNAVRYATLMQNGVEKLKLFNQEKYKFIIPQDDFFEVQGNVIFGKIDETFSLSVQDFLNIPLRSFANKICSFKNPAAGFLFGPNGNRLYFSEARMVAVVIEDPIAEENLFEYLPPLNGIDSRNCYVYSEEDSADTFTATSRQNLLIVNVGTSLYGWNVRFDNEAYMSLRDALEYQKRYKNLPSANGEIIHGAKVLKFFGVERLQARRKTVYYSYGRI